MTGSPAVKSRRLESWKEIAAFLGRDVRTVIRWEKERQLPVHRDSTKPGRPTVYADTDELERWLLGHEADVQPAPSPIDNVTRPVLRPPSRAVWGSALLLLVCLALLGLGATLRTDRQRHLQFTRVDFPAEYPMSVAVADFDRDGNLDIVFTNASGDSVDILFGDGHGSFGRRLSIPASKEPERLAVADLNGDGFPDIAVTYHSSHDINIFLGDGHGNFKESFRWPAGGRSRWITAAADVSRDGIPDLIIACSGAKKVAVGLGRGDGTFDRFREYETDGEASAVIVGDFTHDNIPDLLTADYRVAGGRTVSLYPGVGDGTFQKPSSFSAGFGPLAIGVADFNRDGLLDIATANYYDTVTVLLAENAGFRETDTIHQGKANGFVATGDFDSDGNIDLIVVGEHSNDVRILFGDGQGNFRSSQSWETAAYPDSIAVADFDHDGRQDFVVGAVFGNQVSVYLNRTNH